MTEPIPMPLGARTGVRRPTSRSFTLLELLTVVGILLVLSTLTVATFGRLLRDAAVASATNTVVAALGAARAVALRDNAYVVVTFRVAPDRQTRAIPRDPQALEIIVARWTGEVINDRTPGAAAAGIPDDIYAERYLPVSGLPVRQLPPGILVAGPAFSFTTDDAVGANDRFWRSPPRLAGTETPIDPATGLPGFVPNLVQTELGWGIAVLFGPEGRVLSRNPEQVVEVESDAANPNQNAYSKGFVDVDGNGLPACGATRIYGSGPNNVDFFVYDEPLDEPLFDLVPYLAVFDDGEARQLFDASAWKGTGSAAVRGAPTPAARVADQSRFVEEQADRIVFNRYSGIAGVARR